MADDDKPGFALDVDLAEMRQQLATLPQEIERRGREMTALMDRHFKSMSAAAKKNTDDAGKAAEKAKARLAELAEAGDPAKKLARDFEKAKKEILALKEATGDEAAATAALTAAQKRYEDQLAAINDESKALKEGSEGIGDSAQQLGAGLSMINPQLGELAGLIANASDGAKGLSTAANAAGVSLGRVLTYALPLAAGIAAITAAYQINQRESERITAQRQFEREVAASLTDATRTLRDAEIDLAEATGAMTEAEAAKTRAQEVARRAVLDYAEAQRASKEELQGQIDEAQKYIKVQRGLAAALTITYDLSVGLPNAMKRMREQGIELSDILKRDTVSLNETIDGLTGLESGVADAKGKLGALNGALVEQGRVQGEVRKATDDAAEATRKRAAADTAAAEAAKARTEAEQRGKEAYAASASAMAEESARLARQGDLQRQLVETTRAAQESQLEGLDAIAAARRRELEQLQATGDAAIANAASDPERLAALEAQQQARNAILAKYAAEEQQLQQDTTAAEIAELAKRQQAQQAAAGRALAATVAIGDAWAGLAAQSVERMQARIEAQGEAATAAERAQLEAQLAQREQAARRGWAISKALNVAEATASAATGALEAYTSTLAGLPFPANVAAAPIVAGVVAAAGAAKVAEVAATPAPTFHTGLAPDEYMAKLRVEEGVLNGRGTSAVGGTQAVREMNRTGAPPAAMQPAQVQVQLVQSGRVVESQLLKNVRGGGVLSRVGAARKGHSGVTVKTRGGG